MTARRQALLSCELLALSGFFPFILILFLAFDGSFARVPIIVLTILSAMILLCHHRRDYASPRRIGRRI
ncbi:MAG TPA: hypothetical protein VEW64_03745 [Methyloceanibacter sp.]|jgi:hypothetical protein|nr:hypothetical protein [Methyloceanibacter sp.]